MPDWYPVVAESDPVFVAIMAGEVIPTFVPDEFPPMIDEARWAMELGR